MENLLRDGDYVPNGFGGFTRLYGAQEVLAHFLSLRAGTEAFRFCRT